MFAVAYLAFSLLASRARTGRVNHGAHIAGALVQDGALQGALDEVVEHFLKPGEAADEKHHDESSNEPAEHEHGVAT